ncbi:dihydroorotase [uncultured Finegoldia sp.]|uniref:dihydroorotase n=1 Tax=uncultured Finegoldia sp. TaxID=328009 RepID=UPI00262A1886|nr:dihydroorotase [uncultured Finegoldia sp.]
MKLLLKNCHIIDRDKDIFSDILIEEGRIKSIGKIIEKTDKIIDINNKIVMPGFIDLHTHFRYPGQEEKEDLYTGSLSALAGGYTSCNLMGNTNPVVDNNDVYNQIINKSKEIGLINIYQCMATTKGLKSENMINFEKADDKIKFFSEDGKGLTNSFLAFNIFENIKKINKGIMIHAEDHNLTKTSTRYAEDLETIRDCYLSLKTGCRVHFCHVSTVDSLEAIKFYKAKNAPITCEVTPHHLYMKDSDYRVNPSIRKQEDIDCIIKMIKNSTVDAISTDHAPHTKQDKENGACGMIGLETSFNIAYKVLHEQNNISLNKISELMSYNPAKILKINKGIINPTFDADLVVVDLDKTIKVEKFNSKSSNSPFIGETFKGSIEMTIVNGDIKFEKGVKNDNR